MLIFVVFSESLAATLAATIAATALAATLAAKLLAAVRGLGKPSLCLGIRRESDISIDPTGGAGGPYTIKWENLVNNNEVRRTYLGNTFKI